MISISINMLPPTVNHQLRRRANGGSYLTEDVHVFRSLVWAELAHTYGRMPRWSAPRAGRPLMATSEQIYAAGRSCGI